MEGGHEHYLSEQQRHRRLGNPWEGRARGLERLEIKFKEDGKGNGKV